MCGFAGYYSLTQEQEFETKNQNLLHSRGPDEWSEINASFCWFGHARLAIRDLENGRQPASNDDGILLYNGEIYNCKYLIKKYKITDLNEAQDTQILLYLLTKYGVSILPDLNGMFSFCYYSRVTNSIILVRDPLGMKPLYYRLGEKKLFFSSRLTGLINKPIMYKDAQLKTFQSIGYIPEYEIDDCLELKPGTIVTYNCNDNTISQETYTYAPQKRMKEYNLSRSDTSSLIDVIAEAIQRQLIADIDPTLLLSQGVDSTLIAAICSRVLDINIKTVSYVQSPEDYSSIEKNVNRLGLTWDVQTPDKEKMSYREFEEIVNYNGLLFGDSSLLASYIVMKAAKDSSKLVMTGDGGDELCYGYPRIKLLSHIEGIYNKIHPTSRWILYFLRNSKVFVKSERISRVLQLSSGNFNGLIGYRNYHFDNADLSASLSFQPRQNWVSQYDEFLRQKTLNFDYLRKTDAASSLLSVEARAPLLDLELYSFFEKIKCENSFSELVGKKPLKNALMHILPTYNIEIEKSGFEIDILSILDLDAVARVSQYIEEYAITELSTWEKYLNSKNKSDFKLKQKAFCAAVLAIHKKNDLCGLYKE